jgi:hypothetical protein
MAEWSARMDAQEAARSTQLKRVAAIQAAQAEEAQVGASFDPETTDRTLMTRCCGPC